MTPNKKLQVFISSTYLDLRDERQAAVEAVLAAGHIPAGMELFAAGDESQMNVIKRWINESDIYMLILGGRYGSIESKSQKSYVQLEYEYALEKGKPVFSVVIDEKCLERKVKKFGSIVIETAHTDKLKAFRELVCSKIVRFWNDPRDIKLSIMETMADFGKRPELIGWVPGNEIISVNRVQADYSDVLQNYRNEIDILRSLKGAGITGSYRNREAALRGFARAVDDETREVMIVGSSLKGLLQKDKYGEFADKLRFKIEVARVTVKFLLTHPVVADLRNRQEGRRGSEIGKEIVESLMILRDWHVPPDDIRLYRGSPTCFAIKTERFMLLNPYPYANIAYSSPCLIVETSEDNPGYFYHEFDRSHFSAWDSALATQVVDYERTISQLSGDLEKYGELISRIFET